MGSEAISSTTTTPKLPVFSSLPPLLRIRSPEHSGNFSSPLHTLASVPFRWEERPGKPRPCLDLALPLNNPNTNNATDNFIKLPPRLISKFTKTPSPTTVFEGPYCNINSGSGRSILLESSSSFSFRFLRKRKEESFDGGTVSLGSSPDSHRGLLGSMIVSSSSSFNNIKRDHNNKGLFGSSWRKSTGFSFNKGGKGEFIHADEGNFVFSSFSDDGDGVKVVAPRVSRKKSLLGLSQAAKSHFWANIYGALKQVIPRRSTKWKKDAL